MDNYIPKWHRELEIFSKIKPLILLEGNVLDSYQYPEDGSTPKGLFFVCLNFYTISSKMQVIKISYFTTVCRAFITIAKTDTLIILQSSQKRQLNMVIFEVSLEGTEKTLPLQSQEKHYLKQKKQVLLL